MIVGLLTKEREELRNETHRDIKVFSALWIKDRDIRQSTKTNTHKGEGTDQGGHGFIKHFGIS